MFLNNVEYKKTYSFGIIYTISFLIFGAILNYHTWSSEPMKVFNIIDIGFWALLYLPMFIFSRYADWEINDFGFDLNYKVVVITVLLIIVFIINGAYITFNNWKISLIQMYARTGEELFFRGFIYMLGIKLFNNKKRPWLWAVMISSLSFAFVHTQTFLPEYNTNMIDIFLLAVVLSLFRKWTKSILPGIIIHVFLQSNVFGMLSGVAVYYVVSLLAYRKKEVKI